LILTLTPPYTTQLYTLSLHDALPISAQYFDQYLRGGSQPARRLRAELADHFAARSPRVAGNDRHVPRRQRHARPADHPPQYLSGDRKSTRLNSSHVSISYAVFCLKKK